MNGVRSPQLRSHRFEAADLLWRQYVVAHRGGQDAQLLVLEPLATESVQVDQLACFS